ncbi:MAG TPA: lipoate protein ligase C-terminal domain-containing protein [Deinococcales bacterium]|nr:lipoate protein ligase C-terminal domain-containing protein [Deinococcales bacterium]
MKHGEYKTPGGKLVIVDFTVDSGRLKDVQINGDFFLEPPDALEALNRSLEGAAADASEQELTRFLEEAVPDGAELYGFSPAGIAIAVKRALQ